MTGHPLPVGDDMGVPSGHLGPGVPSMAPGVARSTSADTTDRHDPLIRELKTGRKSPNQLLRNEKVPTQWPPPSA